MIYTSGTTGPPKGVMISQYNVVYTASVLLESIGRTDVAGWKVVSYLPMAHIAERMVSHYVMLMDGAAVHCCPDLNQLMTYLKEVRPQLLFGVPRVFEKIYAGVNAALAADPDKQKQFDDGVALAIEIKRAELAGIDTDDQRDTWAFLDAVAFSTVRSLVGLDELEFAISGAAPIPAAIMEWFAAIGVPLSEIYGMSESSGPMTFSPKRNKPGFVGQPIPGCEVALAEDGEVICRGGNVFVGYLDQPEKTAETIIDGWLHSGDIGEFDDEGYLRIVDRKKELIITSGGKNISPANLEAALKMIPLVGQVCAIGDNRKFISALVVLDPDVRADVGVGPRQGRSLLARTGRRRRCGRRHPGRCRRRQRAVRQRRADQALHRARRGVAARQRRAHPDLEAQAARHPRPLPRRDRGHVLVSEISSGSALSVRDRIAEAVRQHAHRRCQRLDVVVVEHHREPRL